MRNAGQNAARVLLTGLLLWQVAPVRTARAERDSAAQCADSYEAAQLRRSSGDFAAARDAALECISACPVVLGQDCALWKSELERTLGGVLFRTTSADAAANETVSAVSLRSGKALSVNGEIHWLDPGEHVIEFRVGETVHSRRVVVVSGKTLVVDLKADQIEPASSGKPAGSETAASAFPTTFEMVGLGVGVAALGALIAGQVHLAALREGCAPDCAPADRQAVEALFWASGGLGALSLGILGFGYAGRF